MTAGPAAVSAPGAARPVTPMGILVARLGELLDRVTRTDGTDPAVRQGLRDAH